MAEAVAPVERRLAWDVCVPRPEVPRCMHLADWLRINQLRLVRKRLRLAYVLQVELLYIELQRILPRLGRVDVKLHIPAANVVDKQRDRRLVRLVPRPQD